MHVQVPATTNCVRQGITPVPNPKDCSRACLALGFKYTGMRARDNITGCFVLTSGEYKNDCNFNTNTKAHCEPPCTLEGASVQNLCVRR